MIDRAKLRELLAKAWPRPWHRGQEFGPGADFRNILYGPTGAQVCTVYRHAADYEANLALVEAARNALPELLDELDRAEALHRECAANAAGAQEELRAALRAQNDLALERLERCQRLEERLEGLCIAVERVAHVERWRDEGWGGWESATPPHLAVLRDSLLAARAALSPPAPEAKP